MFIGIFVLLAGYPMYLVVHSTFFKPPTCFDGKQNQDEHGIDCGGVCSRPCVGETQDLEVVWSKSLPTKSGQYDIVAKINNPNARARLDSFDYTIKIYGENNIVLYQKDGINHADAGERFVIFEPNVYLGDAKIATTTIEIHKPLAWVQSEVKTTSIQTGKKELTHTKDSSRLNVLLQNTDFVDSYPDVEVTAVVSDITGRPVGVSQTYVDNLPAREDRSIFFTWPMSLKEQTKGLCDSRASLPAELLVPSDVALVFDRSGSMNSDSINPPQPLTDAKNAADIYVKQMLSVDRAALVSFASEASNPIDKELTADTQSLEAAINSIAIGTPNNEQNTNIGDGIKKALGELDRNGRDKAKKAIVLLTDGVATRPLDSLGKYNTKYAEDYAAIQATQAQKENIFVYVIGLGNEINEQFLAYSIASSPERFYKAKTSAELAKIYADIAKAVCGEDVFIFEIYVRVKE